MLKEIVNILDSAEPGVGLPVIAKVHNHARYFGKAQTHAEAELLGIANGVSCERISRGKLDGDARQFYVLH